MGTPRGHIEIERTIESIIIGARHRKDMGDIEALAASIAEIGLLQPPTITPEGVLVCGARRLAAIKKLGWRTVGVWVRSGISDQLGLLLAEQGDNAHHKELTPVEAAALHRELKMLMAEDAARRDARTQFSSEHQPRWNGAGKFPAPLDEPLGDVREHAADMIPGSASYKTLEKIDYLRQVAEDTTAPQMLRDSARVELDAINAGGPVHPAYQRIRAAVEAEPPAELTSLAQEALTRVAGSKESKQPAPAPAAAEPAAEVVVRWPVRAFLTTWSELHSWWDHYDADALAAELEDDDIDAFLSTVEGTAQFAEQLRTARDAHRTGTARGHLRAL